MLQARSMTDKARSAAAGAMNNVRTAIDSAKRIGFNGNTVSSPRSHTLKKLLVLLAHLVSFGLHQQLLQRLSFRVCLQGSNYGNDSQNGNQVYNRHQQYIGHPQNQTW